MKNITNLMSRRPIKISNIYTMTRIVLVSQNKINQITWQEAHHTYMHA